MRIGLFDGCFPNQKSATLAGDNMDEGSENFDWARGEVLPITFYTDNNLEDALQHSSQVRKIAWLIEPPSLSDAHYYRAHRMSDVFDAVLTFNKEFLAQVSDDKWKYYRLGGSWIKPVEWDMYSDQKSKMVSMFTTDKKRAFGHSLRRYIQRKANVIDIDLYGKGSNPVQSKSEGLRQYRYSVVIESIRIPGYFSEKLVDCISQGTIPIYWGDPEIGKCFNMDGIIPFDHFDGLVDILVNTVSEEDYAQRLPAAKSNLDDVWKYACAEDGIYWQYPKLFEEK